MDLLLRISYTLSPLLYIDYLTLAIYITGAAVIFAQFQSINQFRVIGWYNAAWGVALLILLVVMFRGESGCSKPVTCCTGSHGDWRKLLNCTSKPIRVFISSKLIINYCYGA